jgi:hypothetical protein
MNEKDALRVKRFRRAFGDEDGVSELSDSDILVRIELEKCFYKAQSKYIENRISELSNL